MDGSHRYQLRFAPGAFPPVNAFWSLTLYELPASLLSDNPLKRYLINSPLLPSLKKDDDGGLTLHIQHDSPGEDTESNSLPAPGGPFWVVATIVRTATGSIERQMETAAAYTDALVRLSA